MNRAQKLRDIEDIIYTQNRNMTYYGGYYGGDPQSLRSISLKREDAIWLLEQAKKASK